MLLANGAAGGEPLAGDDLGSLPAALDEVCVDLAKSIPADGEGATHLITIGSHRLRRLGNAALRHRQDRGQQPAGENGHPRRRSELGTHRFGGRLCRRAFRSRRRHACGSTAILLYEKGAPVEFDGKAVSDSIRDNRDTLIQLAVQRGHGLRAASGPPI